MSIACVLQNKRLFELAKELSTKNEDGVLGFISVFTENISNIQITISYHTPHGITSYRNEQEI